MNREIKAFGNNKIENDKFRCSKNPSFLEDVYIDNKLI